MYSQVYHMSFKPLEYTVPQRQVDDGYMKLIVDKENEVGLYSVVLVLLPVRREREKKISAHTHICT